MSNKEASTCPKCGTVDIDPAFDMDGEGDETIRCYALCMEVECQHEWVRVFEFQGIE
jgi:hypothetical protein